jgi:hypothetical protein
MQSRVGMRGCVLTPTVPKVIFRTLPFRLSTPGPVLRTRSVPNTATDAHARLRVIPTTVSLAGGHERSQCCLLHPLTPQRPQGGKSEFEPLGFAWSGPRAAAVPTPISQPCSDGPLAITLAATFTPTQTVTLTRLPDLRRDARRQAACWRTARGARSTRGILGLSGEIPRK